LAHPVAEYSGCAKQTEIDFDQIPGREAVISEAGICRRNLIRDPIPTAKSMTHGEAGLVLVFSLSAFYACSPWRGAGSAFAFMPRWPAPPASGPSPIGNR
jgi:hypothetical protein